MKSTPEQLKSAELHKVMQAIMDIERIPKEKRTAYQNAEEDRLTRQFYSLIYCPECRLAQPRVPVDIAA